MHSADVRLPTLLSFLLLLLLLLLLLPMLLLACRAGCCQVPGAVGCVCISAVHPAGP
jgi:hypothetical protein